MRKLVKCLILCHSLNMEAHKPTYITDSDDNMVTLDLHVQIMLLSYTVFKDKAVELCYCHYRATRLVLKCR